LDWWDLGELLGMHAQAAFEEYANLADGTAAPAAARCARSAGLSSASRQTRRTSS
jgi:hypothetical protein